MGHNLENYSESIPTMLVSNWTLAGTNPVTGGNSSFRPTDLSGMAAQGDPDPFAFFPNHCVVLCSGHWFDRSYGDPPVSSMADWEDKYLDAE